MTTAPVNSASGPPSPMGARAGGWANELPIAPDRANDPPTAPDPAPQDSGPRTQDSGLSSVLESLLLAAAKARLTIITQLESTLTTTDDPIEKRRLASTLLRATQAALIPIRRDPVSGDFFPVVRTDLPPRSRRAAANDPLPTPKLLPSPSLDPADIAKSIGAALKHNNDPEAHTGFSTLATFLDDDAELDGEPLPNVLAERDDDTIDDPATLDDLADAVQHSQLNIIRGHDGFNLVTPQPTAPTPNTATIRVRIAGPYEGRTFDFTFRRSSDSRAPNAFLLAAITFIRRDTS